MIAIKEPATHNEPPPPEELQKATDAEFPEPAIANPEAGDVPPVIAREAAVAKVVGRDNWRRGIPDAPHTEGLTYGAALTLAAKLNGEAGENPPVVYVVTD